MKLISNTETHTVAVTERKKWSFFISNFDNLSMNHHSSEIPWILWLQQTFDGFDAFLITNIITIQMEYFMVLVLQQYYRYYIIGIILGSKKL